MDFSTIDAPNSVPNVEINKEQNKVIIPLPSEDGLSQGKLVAYIFSKNFSLFDIDIVSNHIPSFLEGDVPNSRLLKINYCFQGRCELELYNGEYTYLAGGEISLDTGQTKSSFYYPAADYKGIELAIQLNAPWEKEFVLFGQTINAPELLSQKCADSTIPLIDLANEDVSRIMKEIHSYVSLDGSNSLLACKALELMMVLSHQTFLESMPKRMYYTTTQVNIAKAVHDLLMKDLSVRYTAKNLASEFGISETSLKNYFRSVYGSGYQEYQYNARMKKSANLLENTTMKIIEIAENVGYTNQAKFGSTFKTYFGVTPMEYRRSMRFNKAKDL